MRKRLWKILLVLLAIVVAMPMIGIVYMINVLKNPVQIEQKHVDGANASFDESLYFNQKWPSFETAPTSDGDGLGSAAETQVVELRTEKLSSPLGLDEPTPRFSWRLSTQLRDIRQAAFQLQVQRGETVVWDTRWVVSDQSHLVPYAGPALQAITDYHWRVRVRLNNGQETGWSDLAFWHTGFMGQAWSAQWIDPEPAINPQELQPAPYVRRRFALPEAPTKARLYVSAKGLYEAYLNGQRVSEVVFAPGYTDYNHRIQYQVYDVTSLMRTGDNVLGAILGDGWYRGGIGLNGWRNVSGDKLALIAELHITSADGRSQTIETDGSWRATSEGPIRSADMMRGERYDARKDLTDWLSPAYDDSRWHSVNVSADTATVLIDTRTPLPKEQESFAPRVLHTPNGQTILDFGQNMAGYVRFTVNGPSGRTVSLAYGETLDKDGNFTQQNVRQPVFKNDWQQVHYTLNGMGREVYTPRFNVHGFRYVLLENWPEPVEAKNFEARAVYSDLEQTGFVETSDPMVNRFVLNSLWSQKSNFLEIPTDCPQRERSGWTGDAQAYYSTSTLFMNVDPFFDKWLGDLALMQYDNGKIPNMVPFLTVPIKDRDDFNLKMLPYLEGSAGWGDAAVIIPWRQYQYYGNRRELQTHWPMMKAWVNYQIQQAKKTRLTRSYKRLGRNAGLEEYVWDTGFHWGEWLEPDKPMLLGLVNQLFFGEPAVATGYFAYSSGLLAQAADVLGKTEEAAYYRDVSQHAAKAYRTSFAQDGKIESGWQADYVRPLGLGILPDVDAEQVVADLVDKIMDNHYRIGTGFLSTPMILGVLSDYGYHDVAWKMLRQTQAPGWMYPVTKGATTIWENWKAIEEDGTVTFSSLNHYAFGAASSWLFKKVAGIELGERAVAYQHMRLAPKLVADLEFARAQIHSPYGLIESFWERTPQGLKYHVSVPANSSASVTLPAAQGTVITEGGEALDQIKAISNIQQVGDEVSFDLGSGVYNFLMSNM